VSTADALVTALRSFLPNHPAASFTGEVDATLRREILAKLRAGRLSFLVSTTAGITGVDAPRQIQHVAILGAALSSAVEAAQVLGRLRGRGRFSLVEW
jgi:superfamily II DNA or RNA helicase